MIGSPVMMMRMQTVRVYLRNHADRAVPAAKLAVAMGLVGGSHETRRRAVRRVIELMHDDGVRICADSHPTEGGYWLARQGAEWSAYQEARRRDARFRFAQVRRMKEAATDRLSGQGLLFDSSPRRECEAWLAAQ